MKTPQMSVRKLAQSRVASPTLSEPKLVSSTAWFMFVHVAAASCAGTTQDHWMHTVPKRATVGSPRVNLTFRRVVHLEGGGRGGGS